MYAHRSAAVCASTLDSRARAPFASIALTYLLTQAFGRIGRPSLSFAGHLGGPADPRALPTRHGFDSYWGMPHSNVQSCRAGHKEYVDATLFGFVSRRHPTDKILMALLAIAISPWVIGTAGARPWRVPLILLCLCSAGYIYWFTATLTLLNQRGACILLANETIIEQPAEMDYMTLRHTRQATRFLERAARPFFLHLAYPNSHTALFAMDESKGTSSHGAFGDNVQEMDWSLGVILDKLDDLGEREDTLIYFASDNGPFREELDEGGSCGFAPLLPDATPLVGPADAAALLRARTKLKGGKAQTWECGVRVPAIISYPRRWAANWAVHSATSSLDIFPTVLSVVSSHKHPPSSDDAHGTAGADGEVLTTFRMVDAKELRWGGDGRAGGGAQRRSHRLLDGRDISGLLGRAGEGRGDEALRMHVEEERPHSVMLYCGARVTAVRFGKYKAHYETTRWTDERTQMCRREVICGCEANRRHDPPLLFDMHADPAELSPLDTLDDRSGRLAAVLRHIEADKAAHEASIVPVPHQTEILPMLHHFPCCNAQTGTLAYVWKVVTNTCGC
jgi:steryl-sulfatase